MGPRFNARGRGGSRGSRGFRAGGRGGSRRGRTYSRFDSSRLAEKEEVEEDGSPEVSSESEEESSEEEESEPETENHKQAYMTLLQSFESSAQPAVKRRKLDHAKDPAAKNTDLTEPPSEEEPSDDEEREEKDIDHFDEAEEAEEEDEQESPSDDNDDDDKPPDTADPFESHFANPDETEVSRRLEAIEREEWTTNKVVSQNSREIFTLPEGTRFKAPAPAKSVSDLALKQKLLRGMVDDQNQAVELDEVQQKLAPLLFNYYDVQFCERTPDNGASLRWLACLHSVNHIFKTRDRVIKNSEKARDENAAEDVEYRDQGFTRPKVLMLLPTRQSCARMVEAICKICQPEQQENRKRFDDAYVDKTATVGADRPADFRDLFEGNDDDMFRLGLKFTRNSIKYFAQFYNADIILASPLGLRMAMGSEDTTATRRSGSGSGGGSKKGKKGGAMDYDFLSSIEIVLLDQADALLMQNWEHVEHIFAHLNLRPRDTSHDIDFSRVRSWYLDNQARHYRQTVALSAFHAPTLAELFRRYGTGWQGRVRVQPAAYPGVVGRLGVRGIKQTFSRFGGVAMAVGEDPDARFDYFVKAVAPALITKDRGGRATGVLVCIPSYLDFVRVRNWFATAAAATTVSFGAVSEYSSVQEASRALSHFLTGRHRVLLYTERAHHFRRHAITGARTVVLYGLPENPLFYAELAGDTLARSLRSQRLEPGRGAVRVLFSRFDAVKLERIVGSQRVGRMLREASDTFVFEDEF